MKEYIFQDIEFFKQNYDRLFAMRVFYRENQGQLIIKFATWATEKQYLKIPMIADKIKLIE